MADKKLFLNNTSFYKSVLDIIKNSKILRKKLGEYMVCDIIKGQRKGNIGYFEIDVCGKSNTGIVRAKAHFEHKQNLWIIN